MALYPCPECGKEISDKATFCPNCGAPQVTKTVAAPVSAQTATTVDEERPKSQGSRIRSILGILILLWLGFMLWRLWQPALKRIGVLPAPRWIVENAGGDDSCPVLGDYCMRTKCLIRNIGEAAGAVQLIARLDEFGGPSIQKDTMLRLEPGQSETVTLDFREAELGKHYVYVCSARGQ